MSGLTHARSFRDLLVYQRAFKIAQSIFELTKSFPREETYSLTDQIRRSSRSIGAQIAEAWAKRRYEKHFVSKLTDASGEELETEHWIAAAVSCGYVREETAAELNAQLEEIGRMLYGVIRKSALFKRNWHRTSQTRRGPSAAANQHSANRQLMPDYLPRIIRPCPAGHATRHHHRSPSTHNSSLMTYHL